MNNWYIKDEYVLKQPKKPTENNNDKFLLVVLKAKKIPKNNEDKTFTIKDFLKLKNVFVLKLYFMNSLKVSPIVLPNKIWITASKSKLYTLSQPFLVLLGSSINRFVANSTLTQTSPSLTTHLRNIDKEEPELRTVNFLALVLGKI